MEKAGKAVLLESGALSVVGGGGLLGLGGRVVALDQD